MQPRSPAPQRRSTLKASAWTVFSSALIWGLVLAVGSYIGVFASKSQWMSQVFIRDVREDTFAAFTKRFLFGAAAGALIGALIAFRDLRRTKETNGQG